MDQKTFQLNEYFKKICQGVDLYLILENAKEDELEFIQKNIEILKLYKDDLEEKRKAKALDSLRSGTPLKQVFERASNLTQRWMIENLQNLKEIEEMFNPFNQSRPSIVSQKEEATSPTYFKKTSFAKVDSFQQNDKLNTCNEVKKSMIGIPLEKSCELNNSDCLSNYSSTNTGRNSHKSSNFENELQENAECYENVKILFGSTVKGKSLKEILREERTHESWLVWLKYNSHKTKDKETAQKAIAYFSRFSSIWHSL